MKTEIEKIIEMKDKVRKLQGNIFSSFNINVAKSCKFRTLSVDPTIDSQWYTCDNDKYSFFTLLHNRPCNFERCPLLKKKK